MVKRLIVPVVVGLSMFLFFSGCASKNDISNVTEFDSQAQKEIYEFLKDGRENFNQRKEVDLSRFTDNAKLMTHYKKEDIVVSPDELKQIWPEKVQNLNEHKIKRKTIEVTDMKIEDDTAHVKTNSTYYSVRWRKYYKYKTDLIFKKVNGQWKVHKATYKEI
mgnify:CR=1 FL=1